MVPCFFCKNGPRRANDAPLALAISSHTEPGIYITGLKAFIFSAYFIYFLQTFSSYGSSVLCHYFLLLTVPAEGEGGGGGGGG